MLTSCGLRTETTISCLFFLAVSQCEAPCFNLVLLKENVISIASSPAGIPVRKKKNKKQGHTDVGTASVLLYTQSLGGHDPGRLAVALD